MSKAIADLNIQIYADGADLKSIQKHCQNPLIKGFTTNPTLMRKAGIEDYETFALEALSIVDGKPISFEVFSDNLDEMYDQAMEIDSWTNCFKITPQIYVKIPITNTCGVATYALVKELAKNGVKVNATAIFTYEQVKGMVNAIGDHDSIISVFAGRIADTGIDPSKAMKLAAKTVKWGSKKIKLLWASPRHLLDIYKAEDTGCDIITVTDDILKKLPLVGKSLDDYSLETVKMFRTDAVASGYSL